VITTLPGNGSFLYFGAQTLAGTYTVRAINATTACDTMMNGSTILTPLPLIFNITPAGTNCSPVMVGLDGSELGVTYQFFKNGAPLGAPVAGTGAALSFGLQTVGTYFVTAVLNATSCSDTMAGNLVITPGPSVEAGNDTILCNNASLLLSGQSALTSATLWSSTGDGIFANPALLNTTYTPGVNDILSGSVKLYLHGTGLPGCSMIIVTDSLTVTILPVTTSNAGNDTTVCPNVPVQLNGSAVNFASVVWTTFGGDGSFSNNAILNPIYTDRYS
jgi:hypothetical protein